MSSQMQGRPVDLRFVTDPTAAARSGVERAEELIAFAEAVVAPAEDDDASLCRAREALLAAVGPEALVDAASVVGNFQRMVRIADATGIPLDAPVSLFTTGLREDLGLNDFGSAGNTPPQAAPVRLLARWLAPLAGTALRVVGRLYGR